MKRYLWVLSLVGLLACALVACISAVPTVAPALSQTASEDTILVTDQTGRQVMIKPPVRRIVSAYGMASLYVYALGAGDRLVSAAFLMSKDAQIKSKLGLLKPDATMLPDPGGQQDANVEEIAKADPDLILISSRAVGQDTLEALRVPILRYEGESVSRLKEALMITGQALGPAEAERAARLTAYMGERLNAIKMISNQSSATQRPRVFISGTSPLKTAGKDMLQSEMVALAGGVNVAQEISGYWAEVSVEQVIKWDPQVIFVVPYKGASVEAILNSPEWANISAVKNRRVFMLPKYLGPWDTPLPEAVLGIEWMAGKLFPDTALRQGCEARTIDFYQRFYDLAIPAEDAIALCR